MKKLTFKFSESLLYFFAIGFGFCVDYLIYSIFVFNGTSIYLANTSGFIVGFITNVLLIRRYVFLKSRFQLLTDIPLTFIANGLVFCVGMALLGILVESSILNPYWAKLLVNVITFVLNFISRAIFFRVI
jgi:putative flippase GtrA